MEMQPVKRPYSWQHVLRDRVALQEVYICKLMNDRFVLFLVGPKGYAVLEEFCRQNLELSVRSVVVAKKKI